MTAPREKWTDDRLDDLKGTVEDGFARADKKMDDGFARVDTDIRELKGEMNRQFGKVDEKFEKVDARFDKLNERFDQLNWRLLVGTFGIIAALIGNIFL